MPAGSLVVLNGLGMDSRVLIGLGSNLGDRLAKENDNEKVAEELFLSVLSRRPTAGS